MTFYDRADELDAPEKAFESPDHAVFVIYGCRRVGKTELLNEFCADRSDIYFVAAQEAEIQQREKFVEKLADYFNDRFPRFDEWDETLDYLGEETHQRFDCLDLSMPHVEPYELNKKSMSRTPLLTEIE